jgi:hypothetical protein
MQVPTAFLTTALFLVVVSATGDAEGVDMKGGAIKGGTYLEASGRAAAGAGSVRRTARMPAHVVLLTPRPGRVVVAADADGDGMAEAIAVADDVAPFDDVPAYSGAGVVLRNDVGLTVVATDLKRNLSFALIDGAGGTLGDAPTGATYQRQRFTVRVLDAYLAPVALALLPMTFEKGWVAICQPACVKLPDNTSAGSCTVTCRDACAACGRWRGLERCACVSAFDADLRVR